MDLKHIFHALQLESPKRILELDLNNNFESHFFLVYFHKKMLRKITRIQIFNHRTAFIELKKVKY